MLMKDRITGDGFFVGGQCNMTLTSLERCSRAADFVAS